MRQGGARLRTHAAAAVRRALRRALHGAAPVVVVATVAGAALVSPPASAQAAGGLEISPSRVEQDVETGTVQVPVTITNHWPSTKRVTVRLAGLSHDLDGQPIFGDEPGWGALEPSGALDVPGDTSITTVLTFTAPAGMGRYAAVLASTKADDGALGIESRVASLVLVRGPRPWVERVSVRQVELTPTGSRTYRISAVVHDDGDVHVRPTGTIQIRRGEEVLATVQLASQLILPGSARRLTATWTAPEGVDPGSLTTVVDLDGPAAGGTFTPTLVTDDGDDAAAPAPEIGDGAGGGGATAAIADHSTDHTTGAATLDGAAADTDEVAARASGIDPGVAVGAGIAVLVLVAVSVAAGLTWARNRERRAVGAGPA